MVDVLNFWTLVASKKDPTNSADPDPKKQSGQGLQGEKIPLVRL